MPASRRSALVAAGVLVAGTLTAIGVANAPASSAATTSGCGTLFDDFAYSSSSDSTLTSHGWVPRSYAGGPGVAGATWSPSSISFPTVDGQKAARLTGSTDGTSGGTNQAELYTSQKRYFEGTYASRIRFTDTPTTGADGDHVNETYFTISPLNGDLDPTYSELDMSEYLPNGGWGVAGPIDYETTWYTYQNDPWYADNVHSQQSQSYDGWHTLVTQVSGGHVKYYIDGTLVGDHSGKYYPRQTMTINYNLWFIDTAGHTGGLSTYVEDVDWSLYVKNAVLSPADATAQAAAYRTAGTTFADTVDTATGPCVSPTGGPTATASPTVTASPTRSPSPSPTPSVPPGSCKGVPAWNISSVYNTGDKVVHTRSANGDPNGPPSGDGPHLWQAKWWTQGSEPGWTAQWTDLGKC